MYSRDPLRKDLLHASVLEKGHSFLEESFDVGELAEEDKLQCQRRDSISPPGVGDRDDKYATSPEREGALSS